VKAYYIVGTHWDREWYQSFQEFRMRLVQTVDHAMDLLEARPEYCVFHLDGQGILIEDYLEIRPENRERLVALVKSQRMPAGPWYVLPDEFLVSGEAFIRNLQMGMRVVRSVGAEPASVGYLVDMFGHVASMPMILAGFGLKGAVVWRGIGDEEAGAQFIWVGPDGSRMPTHKLTDEGGYGRVDGWPRGKGEGYDAEHAREMCGALYEYEKERTNAPLLYLSDALDHRMAAEDVPAMLDDLRKAFPDVEFIHGTVEDYFDELAHHLDKLPEHSGELRSPAKSVEVAHHWLIPHCISSRYPLKQANDRCQNLLTLWAEPMAAMAAMAGCPVPPGYLEVAWRWLIRNHPHDSICGCSIDAVHRDMEYRFDQAERLADGARRQGMAALANPSADVASSYQNVVLHNPLPWARDEVVTLDLAFPGDFAPKRVPAGMCGPSVNQFTLRDEAGAELPYQLLTMERGRMLSLPGERGPNQKQGCDVCRVAVPVQMPAGGHCPLRVEPLTDRVHRNPSTLRTGPLSAGNEFFDFELRPDGTAMLESIDGEVLFADLFQYEDTGDRGDGWMFAAPMDNRTIVSPGATAQCGVEYDGPQMVTFRVDRTLRVPKGLATFEGERRSEQWVELAVTDRITVKNGCPYLHVHTSVDNVACDHRLRVLFPSDVPAETYYADQPFVFVERPVEVNPESHAYMEMDPVERPHHTVFGIEDEQGGLAVLCPEGLHEHSVYDDDRRTLALTLYRSFARTVGTEGEPGGELLQNLEFEYALYPYAGEADRGKLVRMVAELQAGVQRYYAKEPVAAQSLIELAGSPAVVSTAVKPADDGQGIVVRLWNTGGEAADAELRVAANIKSASLCDLGEGDYEALKAKGNSVALQVAPYALASVRILTS